ncbi:hypothetical protein K4039_17520 [Lyngbya sp. CCAP 1446/10]|uniref:hypothetical protein n=1 Tax=Lyngbya sp. CCAP 1446/10 TaxID=439293 RepID=UPI0022389BC4|nr:hypothetical protein [Lyngbya sp. CCAP 1446/10]MCW6051842.1 hypothetical protein [Lyngbya sp. CCAP 1446/10]
MRHAADLQKCLQQLETAAKIESFPLADQDISDKFQIPQKLYGSEAEVAIAVMPQLEMIIDRQPDVPEFGTTEAQSGHKYFPHTGC